MSGLRWSFRRRLSAVMLAVGVLPLALTALVTLQLSKAYLRELAVKRSEAVLDTVRADLERYATHRIHQLQMLAAGPAVQGLEPAKAGQAMADFLGSTSFFSEVQLLRASGEAIAATASPARSELPAPDRAALRAWLGGLSVPDLAQAPARVTTAPGRGGRPLCIYTVAVPSFGDPARPVGALRATAVLDGTGIQDVLGSYALQEDDYLAILDPTAEIVARAGTGLGPSARRMVLPAGVPETPVTLEAQNGTRTDLVSLAPVSLLAARVVVGQPLERALRLTRALALDLAVITVLAVLGAVVAGLLLARSVSRPVLALARAIDLLREGVLDHRLEDLPDDELGEAGRSFNDLAELLQRRTLIASIWQKLRDKK